MLILYSLKYNNGMFVYTYQLRENDKFTLDGVLYRKLRLKYDALLGLSNAEIVSTGVRVNILDCVKLTPSDEYYNDRITPTSSQTSLRKL